ASRRGARFEALTEECRAARQVVEDRTHVAGPVLGREMIEQVDLAEAHVAVEHLQALVDGMRDARVSDPRRRATDEDLLPCPQERDQVPEREARFQPTAPLFAVVPGRLQDVNAARARAQLLDVPPAAAAAAIAPAMPRALAAAFVDDAFLQDLP